MTARTRPTMLKQRRIVLCQCGKLKRVVLSMHNADHKMIVYCPDCLPKKKCVPIWPR